MEAATVLVVVEDGADAVVSEIAAATSVPDPAVDEDPAAGFLALCRNPTAGLLVDSEVRDGGGVAIARAARRLFPDLPVVIRGLTDPPETLADPVAAVPEDGPVVETLAETLAGTETRANRHATIVETVFLSLFEGFPVHLFVKDRDARHVLTNHEHIDPTPVLGRADDQVEDDESDVFRDAIAEDDRRVIREGEPLTAIEEYSDKLESYLLTAKVPWFGPDGSVDGLIGMTRDVTERRHRERELRSSNERLRRVALKAAHEMRNELQVAAGRLELIDADDPVDDVAASHARLSGLIDEVVDLASQTSDTGDCRELRLSAVARETWRTMASDGGTLSVASDRLFAADPDGARLLFETLYENALEHASPEVSVTVGELPHGFYVADDGPGVAAEPAEVIFQAGYSTLADSSGLGLYVARSIAEDHGWSMTVCESDAGGARFEVRGVERL